MGKNYVTTKRNAKKVNKKIVEKIKKKIAMFYLSKIYLLTALNNSTLKNQQV